MFCRCKRRGKASLIENTYRKKYFISKLFSFFSPAHGNVAQILSQRSRCLLKMGNHYLALEDGRRLAEMDSGSLLGHQRCAEVFQDSCHFSRAHDEYLRCFQVRKISIILQLLVFFLLSSA